MKRSKAAIMSVVDGEGQKEMWHLNLAIIIKLIIAQLAKIIIKQQHCLSG